MLHKCGSCRCRSAAQTGKSHPLSVHFGDPCNIPEFAPDATNCHVRTQFHYLDEATLINEDLPSELPFSIEKGNDRYNRTDLYSFNGPQCCYLVREFVSHEKVEDIRLVFNASCPFECYLDGKLIQSRYTHNQGSVYRKLENVTFTGKNQRLVVKLASRITNFEFNLAIVKGSNSRTRAYSPHFSGYSIKKGK